MPEMGPGIVLVGMPGSGKSTVGRLIAERLGRPFVDTDTVFERLHGTPVPDYLHTHGEPAFREAEAATVAQACAQRGAVIGAGGGSIVDPLNRWALWHHGAVAWLDVPPETLVRRLRSDAVARPTFQPYDAPRLASVLAERAPFYRAADVRLDATQDPTRVADELVRLRPHSTARRLYDAEVLRHHPIGPDGGRVVMGVDLDFGALAPHGLAVVDPRSSVSIPARARLEVEAGERAKRMRRLASVLEWLAMQRAERDEPVIAIGGGTVGDLAGTAAALFNRGLPLIQVPTTWLAQADSAFGGKVAVDLATAKNAVGAFWPPVAVLSDVAALRSLPARQRRNGIAESVKAALIGDPGLWRLIEARGRATLRDDEPARYAVLERSARVKLAVCARDPFETGERRTLNLGHTIGHGLEMESGYRLAHGAAVALGLRVVASIAVGRGGDADLPARLDHVLEGLGLVRTRPFDTDALRAAMLADKKRRAGRQRWILPMGIGRVVEVDDVTDAELRSALRVISA
jgi:shikimate kinase/3-dehydroquinate synthase